MPNSIYNFKDFARAEYLCKSDNVFHYAIDAIPIFGLGVSLLSEEPSRAARGIEFNSNFKVLGLVAFSQVIIRGV